MNYLLPWSIAFCWTLAIEAPIYALALRTVSPRRWTPVLVALLVNFATHPAFSVWIVVRDPERPAIIFAELAIALIESALVYASLKHRCSPLRALAAGALANSVSYLIGELLPR